MYILDLFPEHVHIYHRGCGSVARYCHGCRALINLCSIHCTASYYRMQHAAAGSSVYSHQLCGGIRSGRAWSRRIPSRPPWSAPRGMHMAPTADAPEALHVLRIRAVISNASKFSPSDLDLYAFVHNRQMHTSTPRRLAWNGWLGGPCTCG